MSKNLLAAIHDVGQSIWLDYIHRDLLTSGELKSMVEAGEIYGLTSNPTIFEKAITGGSTYDDALRAMLRDKPDANIKTIYESLAIEDIRMATDIIRPVFDRSNGDDGYVSLEVSPKLARDTRATIEEARRLYKTVDRPNLMIKIPATPEGLPAITQAISEDINVNVTLMFSLADYDNVADAYLSGLEKRKAEGNPINTIASVSSFFVSRLDGVVDKQLPEDSELFGKIAVANAKLAYARFRETFESDRYKKLQADGARIQRILWGSTGTKNKAYSDVLYVQELIGPDSVNTAPPATLDKFRDHGQPSQTIDQGLEEAQTQIDALKGLNIDLDAITLKLQDDGVISFEKSFDNLLAALTKKREELLVAK